MKWMTRERAQVDRIACPWLISRFIDPQPEFLYVPADQVLAEATTQGAIPYDIPALHNHFFWESLKVMFMHIGGMGSAETLAGAVGKVFATIKETSGGKGSVPHVELDPAKTSLDPKPIEDLLGVQGQMANGVYKVTVGRATNMHGHDGGNTMGVST
jgi:Chromate resistance exported protein/Domain of Unknown Function (DUF1259)